MDGALVLADQVEDAAALVQVVSVLGITRERRVVVGKGRFVVAGVCPGVPSFSMPGGRASRLPGSALSRSKEAEIVVAGKLDRRCCIEERPPASPARSLPPGPALPPRSPGHPAAPHRP